MPRPLLIAAAVALAGCAHVTETRTQTVVATRPIVAYQRREPERDRTDVTFESDGGDVRAHVERTLACARGLAEEVALRERVVRTPDPGRIRTDVVLGAAGLLLLTGTLVAAESCTTRNEETGRNEPCLGLFLLPMFAAGAGLTVVGGGSALIDASKESDTSRLHRSVTPVVRVEREPCSRGAAAGSIVALDLASGTSFTGRVDEAGVATIHVPRETWVEAGGALDVDVRVDGLLVRRATLRWSPP